MTITGNFERFQCLYFETFFLKNENLFRKSGEPFFGLKYFRCKNKTFPEKSALSEDNVNGANRIVDTKWNYQKNDVFQVSTYFFENFV